MVNVTFTLRIGHHLPKTKCFIVENDDPVGALIEGDDIIVSHENDWWEGMAKIVYKVKTIDNKGETTIDYDLEWMYAFNISR